MNEKIGMYTEDEILEHLTEGEGRGFLGRSMYDAIFDKIHALKNENEQLKEVIKEVREYIEDWLFDVGGNGASMTYEDINELLQILDKVKD